MMPARQLSAGSRANSVRMCLWVWVCVCACVRACMCLCVHRGVDTHWPITAMKSDRMSQWKQSLTRVDDRSFCAMSICIRVGGCVHLYQCDAVRAGVSECVRVLLRRLRIKDHVGRMWEGGGREEARERRGEKRRREERRGEELAGKWQKRQTVNLCPWVPGLRSWTAILSGLAHGAHTSATQKHNICKWWKSAQKDMTSRLVMFAHFHIKAHTLAALFVHCAAWWGQMERAARGKGWGHVRELEPGSTASLKSTHWSVSPMGDPVRMLLECLFGCDLWGRGESKAQIKWVNVRCARM